MSRKANDWAWSQKIKPATDKLILLALADRAGEEHECYPSIKRLEDDTSLNRKTIQAGIIRLIESGLVSDTGRRCGPTQRVRVLQLHVECTQKRDNTEIGNVPENGINNVPENGTLNGPEIGTLNQSLEPVIEPIKQKGADAGVIGGRTDRKKARSKTADQRSEFITHLINKGVDAEIAEEWADVRKKKGSTLTIRAIGLVESQAEKAGVTLAQAVENCALRGWAGFKAEWMGQNQIQRTEQNRQHQPQTLKPFPMG